MRSTRSTVSLWQKIVKEIVQITERALFTVGTRNEADLVREWATSPEKEVRVFENTRDPIYDRWVCDITDEIDRANWQIR